MSILGWVTSTVAEQLIKDAISENGFIVIPIIYGEEKEYSGGLEFNDYLTTVFKIISDLLYFFFDGAGFGEM